MDKTKKILACLFALALLTIIVYISTLTEVQATTESTKVAVNHSNNDEKIEATTLTLAVERCKKMTKKEQESFLGDNDTRTVIAIPENDGYGFLLGMDYPKIDASGQTSDESYPEATTVGAIKEALNK